MKDTAHLKGFGRISSHLIALGVSPSESFRFQRYVDHLIRTRGTKGALLWLESLGSLVSERVFKIRVPSPTWVSRRHLRPFKSAKSRALMRRLTKVKRCVVERQITAAQAKKFLDATLRPAPNEEALHEAKRLVVLGTQTLRQYLPKHQTWTAPECLSAYVKRELTRGWEPHEAYERATKKLRRDCARVEAAGLLNLSPIRDTFRPLGNAERYMLAQSWEEEIKEVIPFGTLNCTQEPGGKARLFAAPLLCFQEALVPLQQLVMDTCRAIPEDACFDEHEAVLSIQEKLRAGQEVMIADLSEATNAWPATLSWITLNELRVVPTEHLQLLIDVSWGHYEVAPYLRDSGFFPSFIQWTQGQPLGSKPSFGAFALSHHAFIRGICLDVGSPTSSYRLKGDDLVFFCEKVYCRYVEIVTAMGVGIPREKSVVSRHYSEFAGQTILSTEAFYPGKWREVGEDSLWTFILDPDYDYTRVVPKLWARLIRRMKETPYPFGLNKPVLESLDPQALEEFSQAIEELFLVRFLTQSSDESLRPEFVDNIKLVSNFLYEASWATLLYPDLARDHPLAQRQLGDRKRFLATCCYRDLGSDHALKMRPSPTSRASFYVATSTATNCLLAGFKYNDIPMRKRVRLSQVYMTLPEQVSRDLTVALSLIKTLVLGAQGPVSLWEWIDSVPLLHEKLCNTTRSLTHLDLVHTVITHFPYFEAEDFSKVTASFVEVLRKYSRPTEIMPSRATPLPHLKRG